MTFGLNADNMEIFSQMRLIKQPAMFSRGKFLREKIKAILRSIVGAKIETEFSMSETVNSMLKRKMGETVYGKTMESVSKEIRFTTLAHNLRLILEGGLIRF